MVFEVVIKRVTCSVVRFAVFSHVLTGHADGDVGDVGHRLGRI